MDSSEKKRLQTLDEYAILDTEAEEPFDDITALASQICGVPISLVSLVDARRQWFKSKVGLSDSETPRDIAFCAHTIMGDKLLEVPDANLDKRFRENPLVTSDPRIRFYAGAPLIAPNGYRLGSLCVIDRQPRQLSKEQRRSIRSLSSQVVRLMEMRRQQIELADAFRRLRESEDMRESLIQMIVHDLRAPLSGLYAYLELAGLEALPAEAATYVQKGYGCAEELMRQINALLDISKMEAGQLQLKLSEVDLKRFAEDLEQFVQPLLRRRTLTIDVPKDIGVVRCDKDLIARVARNLLANALRHTNTETGTLAIKLERTASGITTTVSDNGPGIPEALRDRVFDKFFQVKPDNGHRRTTGLGLTFCKLAVETHGGHIGITGDSSDGTDIFFTLPTSPPEA